MPNSKGLNIDSLEALRIHKEQIKREIVISKNKIDNKFRSLRATPSRPTRKEWISNIFDNGALAFDLVLVGIKLWHRFHHK